MTINLKHVKSVTSQAFASGAYKRLKGRERIAVFIRQVPLEKGSVLPIGPRGYKVEADSYLVYIDLMHDANFTHPVIYELHNLKDGSVKTIEEEFPISDPEFEHTLIPHILPEKKEE